MKQRSYHKELLDSDDIPTAELIRNLKELNIINQLLGGHRITCKGVDLLLNQSYTSKNVVIAEIGCGGGDNLKAISSLLLQKGQPCTLIGIDLKQECIDFASSHTNNEITWICSDYSSVEWPDKKPDIIFSSLFCHHFTDDELVNQLIWMKNNSRLGCFINDLHRHPVAYFSIRLLTSLFSKSYLVKNDAPLSVKRGFKRKEWVKLLIKAGISNYTIKWQWAFRYLICIK